MNNVPSTEELTNAMSGNVAVEETAEQEMEQMEEEKEVSKSKLEMLGIMFDEKFPYIPYPHYTALPDNLLKAFVVLILESIVITPSCIRIDPEIGTKMLILSGELELEDGGEPISEDGAEAVNDLIEALIAVTGTQLICTILQDMLEQITKEKPTNKEVKFLVDDVISIAQMTTTSQVIGEHLEVLTSRIGGALNLSPMAVYGDKLNQETPVDESDLETD